MYLCSMKKEFCLDDAEETGWGFSDLSYHNTVKFDGKWGIIDDNGWLSTPCIFDEIVQAKFSWKEPIPTDSYYTVRKGNKFGIINHGFCGKVDYWIQLGQYNLNFIDGLINGITRVCKNKKWGIINWMGEIIIPLEFDAISEFYISENPIVKLKFGEVEFDIDLGNITNSNPFKVFPRRIIKGSNHDSTTYSDSSAYNSKYYDDSVDFDQQSQDFWENL